MEGGVCIKLGYRVLYLGSWILRQPFIALEATFSNMKSFLVGAGLLGLASAIPHRRQGSTGTPSVTVKNGTIEGLHSDTYNEDYFLGIPFAQPPVDDLRFRNPQSINTSFDGVLQATEYAPECYGYGVSYVLIDTGSSL